MRRSILILIVQLYSITCFTQVILNPVYDWSNYEVLHPHIDKVELKQDSTKIFCSFNYQESWSYNVPKTMFLEDLSNNRRYQIAKCIGLPFEPEERVFNHGGTFQFVFCFPHIDNLRKFNLIEDPSKERFFNIYGIDVSNYYPEAFEEAEYKRFKNMSDFYKSSGDIHKFVEFEKKELSAAQYIFGKRSCAAETCYNQLAHYYNEVGDYKKAIDLGFQALECDSIHLGVENKEYPVYAYTLGSLSQFYQNAGNDFKALYCKQKCISIWRNLGSDDNYLKEIYDLLISGKDYLGIKRRIEIVEYELNNLPNFVDATSKSIAIIQKQMALSYWMIDDNKNAISCCDKALWIYNKNGDVNNEEYADLLGAKCKYQRYSLFSREAIETGERAKLLYDSLNIKSLQYAELVDNLAKAYGQEYNYEKSIVLQNISVEIYENAKDWISLAEAYGKISDYYQRAERLDGAEQYIKLAISVLNDHDDVNQIINANAKRLGDESIITPFALSKIKERLDYNRINYSQTLAKIYQKRGKIADAINTEKKNLLLIKNMGDNKTYPIHLMIMAQYYLLDKQYNNAKECVEQAIQFDGDQHNIANYKILLSHICYEMGDTIKAMMFAKESVSYLKIKRDIENLITAEYALSVLYWKSNEYSKAEQTLSETLDLLRDNICNEFTRMTSEQKQRIWAIYENYFILYRHIIEKYSKNELVSKLYDYVLFSKSLLLESEIQEDANRLNITWKDIQQQMSDNDIAIEFITTFENDKNCPSPRMITLYSETKLEEIKKATTRKIRNIVGELIWNPIIAQYGTAKNIYFSPDIILHVLPIEYYNIDSTKNMFEHYNMYRLSSTKELIKKHDYQQRSSAVLYGGLDYNQLNEAVSRDRIEESTSLWRGIAERGGFDPLFNTLLETQEINELLQGNDISTTLYSGANGTEESFRNLSKLNISIMHLATHGMYVSPERVEAKRNESNFDFLESLGNENDPVREDVALTHSFLVMSGGNRILARDPVPDYANDGILTSKEISQLNLKRLDLVVLSACESALGDVNNGGVYGLQRGFKKAGANTILMSLDKVDDEATRILMVEFYRNLMNGKTKLQSLQKAQQHLRQVESGKYDDPKYWASFIMLDGLD